MALFVSSNFIVANTLWWLLCGVGMIWPFTQAIRYDKILNKKSRYTIQYDCNTVQKFHVSIVRLKTTSNAVYRVAKKTKKCHCIFVLYVRTIMFYCWIVLFFPIKFINSFIYSTVGFFVLQLYCMHKTRKVRNLWWLATCYPSLDKGFLVS